MSPEKDEPTIEQLKAIKHFRGPALVIAGPGAGKTFIITERVKYLISEKSIDPKRMLVTTFTEKAADELKIKLAQTIGRQAELIHISTIHSFCKNMLEKCFAYHEYGANIDVLDEESQKLLIDINKANFGIAYWEDGHLVKVKKTYDFINSIRSFYDKLTQNRVDPNKLIDSLKKKHILSKEDEKVISSYGTYLGMLRKERKVDFTSLQTIFFDLMENNKEVLKDVQDSFDFILVDEYQDTSPIQDRIFRLIAGDKKNLFVVGDVNQSIYGFRGATVRNFMKFTHRYPEAQTYRLKVNFRSTDNIVQLSNRVFESTVKEELESRRRKGEKTRLLYGEDSDSTAKKAIDLVQQLKRNNIIKNYGDVALLFRSVKNHAQEFIKYLTKENIPHVTFGEGQFVEREEIRTIIYLMSYVTQELYIDNKFHEWKDWWKKDMFTNDFLDFSEKTKSVILNGNFNLYDLRDEEDFKKQGFSDKNDISKLIKLNKLKHDVEKGKDSFGDPQRGKDSLLVIFYKILDYSGFFKRLMGKKTLKDREILQNLGQLSEIINRYMDISKKEDLKGFLWHIYNSAGDIDQNKIEDENTVKLMTVHQAKGLEFPVVLLCCLNEGRFPLRYRDSEFVHVPDEFLDKEDIEDSKEAFMEEERRLFYVGITRAQDNLIFTASEKHRVNRWKMSRFLEIIPEKLMMDEDFRLAAEKHYRVKKEVPNLNYSAINAFIDCPLRYTLTYDYDFATPPSYMQRVGTFIHNSLQQIHENVMKGKILSPKDVREIVDKYWMDLPISEEKNIGMRERMLKELITYYVSAKDDYMEILAVEESFSHIDDNMILKGKVDLIVRDKDKKVCLIDFKARTKKGIEKTNVGAQLQIYNHCLSKNYNIDKLIAHTVEDNQKTCFSAKREETMKFLSDISEKMAKEDFCKQKNAFCGQCQFKFYCWEG